MMIKITLLFIVALLLIGGGLIGFLTHSDVLDFIEEQENYEEEE